MKFSTTPQPYVIVIDDMLAELGLVKRAIQKSFPEVSVHCCTSAPEALALLDIHTAAGILPSLVICDLNMPEMDGFEFVSIAKAQHDQQFPIILLSNTVDETRLSEALRSGADQLYEKPFSYQETVHMLSVIIQAFVYPSMSVPY